MESNCTRWCFYKSTDPSAITIYIEGNPFSFIVGYRTVNEVHLYLRDFYSFFKCLLLQKYFLIDYGDISTLIEGFKIENNTIDLSFSKHSEYNPIMCIKNNEAFYLSNTIHKPQYESPTIIIYRHPSINEFAEKLDVSLIKDFLVSYLKQSNIKIFGYIILSIVTEFVTKYKEKHNRITDKEFFEKFTPTLGDFMLYDCLITYASK